MADTLPKEQWAQVVQKTGGPPEYKKIAVPTPGPDQVLVNIKFSGVCHTDLHAMMGDWPIKAKLPYVGGHEGAGVVVARGNLVSGIELGDHVGIKWLNGSCLACTFCLEGNEQLCTNPSYSGFTINGTFQQYALAQAAHVARIPKDCDLEAIAPILCAGITVYRGLKESGARSGQEVAIVGAGGGLGTLAIRYAKAMGLIAIAIDSGNEKRDTCLSLGADAYVDHHSSQNLVADVKAATLQGLGPHAVLLVAAHEKPFQQATEYVRSNGTVVCMGMPANANISAPVFETVVRMVSIKGSYVGNRADTAEALDFFRRGLVKASFKTVGLSKLPDVFDMMRNGKIAGRYVLDTSK